MPAGLCSGTRSVPNVKARARVPRMNAAVLERRRLWRASGSSTRASTRRAGRSSCRQTSSSWGRSYSRI
eukprot:scaffold106115_cov66-Phaeocystis_antarctica.AAC.2